jgi:diguanylate cyclase (GGDEF)-like protein
MSSSFAFAGKWRARLGAWDSPFTAPVPVSVQDRLIKLQSERLHGILPLLCLTIAACAVAMSLAVLGDLPWWQQLAPPAIIIGTCLAVLVYSRIQGQPKDTGAAHRTLRMTLILSTGLGLVAGLWCVNAFNETEQYYCMVAPVFIGIAALVSASCLLSVPRAAIAAIVATTTPIVIKMALYDNLGVRAMAAMLVIVGVMQSGVVLAKFRETIAMLTMQYDLNRLAESDSLTGLDNRLSFIRKLDDRLAKGATSLVALADLDGFKLINDTYGHQAGDALLSEVARRMKQLSVSAISVARLGGDEFALLFDTTAGGAQARDEITAVAAQIPLPLDLNGDVLSVGLSMGTATSPQDGYESAILLAAADRRLYLDKASRKQSHRLRAVSHTKLRS